MLHWVPGFRTIGLFNYFTVEHILNLDLFAILQKSLDRALFLYIFILEARMSGIRASISIVHIRNSTKSNGISFDPDSF